MRKLAESIKNDIRSNIKMCIKKKILGQGDKNIKVGSGNDGTVYKVPVMNHEHCPFVAVKITDSTEEGNLMKRLEHPNIVNVLYGPTPINGRVYTALDYCEQSLKDKITKYGSDTNHWPLHKRLDVLIQIATGMQYLVNQGIAHRDLKPDNVLLATRENQEVAKIADFGLSTTYYNTPQRKYTANIGTPVYMAPEVVVGTDDSDDDSDVIYNPVLIDIYSFGILMWSVLSGLKPYKKEVIDKQLTLLELFDNIINHTFRPNATDVHTVWNRDDAFDATIIVPIIEIMKKCWEREPRDRYQSFDNVKSELNNVKSKLLEHY